MKRILPSVAATLVALLCSLAAAQAAPQGSPLVGMWTTTIAMDGGTPIEGRLLVTPDDRYREEMVVQGQLAGFWEGSLSLAPDGTLTQTETAKSPQLCLAGQCQPNDGPTTTVSRIVGRTPNSFTLAYRDPASGQSFQLTWQRAAGAPGAAPQPPAPGAPQPNGAGNPLGGGGGGATADPWAGTWSDGDLVLVLAGPSSSWFERGGVRYPLQLQGDAQRLQGSFVSDGNAFPVTLERAGGGVVLSSGGARFELAPVAAAGPAQPANPLGN